MGEDEELAKYQEKLVDQQLEIEGCLLAHLEDLKIYNQKHKKKIFNTFHGFNHRIAVIMENFKEENNLVIEMSEDDYWMSGNGYYQTFNKRGKK